MASANRSRKENQMSSMGHPPRFAHRLRRLPEALAARDPGFAATRAGLLAAAGTGLAASLAAALSRAARSMGAGPPDPTTLALVGGVVALMSALSVGDRTMAGQARTAGTTLLAFVVTMTVGLATPMTGPLLDVVTVLVAGLAVVVRRGGPRWTAAGVGAFNGWFVALMLVGGTGADQTGWLVVAALCGTVAYLTVRATIVPVSSARLARRLHRTWRARARRLLLLGADALDDVLSEAGQADAVVSLGRRRRQLVDLTETTLMLDATYAGLDAPDERARALFEAESALIEAARLAGELATEATGPELRHAARTALRAAADPARADVEAAATALAAAAARADRSAPGRATAVRLATTLPWYSRADTRAGAPDLANAATGPSDFVPVATLQGEFLVPGARPHATAAARSGGRRARPGLPLVSRLTLQTLVAMSGAMLLGHAVLGHAPTWGVLTIFYALMAGMNAADHVRRGLHRLAGTAAGVVMGAGLASVIGGGGAIAVAVTVPALFVGVALIRVRYLIMPMATSVVLAQFEHVVTGAVPWDVLGLRLAETLVGVAGVILAVLVVVPVRPRQVLTTAREQWAVAQTAAVEAAMGASAEGGSERIAAAVRDADLAYLALRSVLTSAEITGPGAHWGRFLDAGAGVRLYTRLLAACAMYPAGSDRCGEVEVRMLLLRLREAVDSASAALDGDRRGDLALLREAVG